MAPAVWGAMASAGLRVCALLLNVTNRPSLHTRTYVLLVL